MWNNDLASHDLASAEATFGAWIEAGYLCYRTDKLKARQVNGWLRDRVSSRRDALGGRVMCSWVSGLERKADTVEITFGAFSDAFVIAFRCTSEDHAMQLQSGIRANLH